MGFFDKMGETISTKSKDVAKKAKEMAEVSSLNSQISSQKDIITKIHKEIGEMVCVNREAWTELNLDDQFARLDAAGVEIERLQSEIYRVKNIKLCANCGAEMPGEAAFCPGCGTSAPVVEVPRPAAEEVRSAIEEQQTESTEAVEVMETVESASEEVTGTTEPATAEEQVSTDNI